MKPSAPRASGSQQQGAAGACGGWRAPAGFTLLELVLVIVLMAVLAGVTLPRLAGNERRQAELELGAVETFLTAAAEREAFTSQPIGISFDASAAQGGRSSRGATEPSITGQLTFWVRRTVDPKKSEVPEWVQDPLVPPVRLSVLTLREATAGGLKLEPRSWRVNFPQSEPRPNLSLLFSMVSAGTSGSSSGRSVVGSAWQVDLPSESVTPVRTPMAASFAPHVVAPRSRSIDLDATGQGNQAW